MANKAKRRELSREQLLDWMEAAGAEVAQSASILIESGRRETFDADDRENRRAAILALKCAAVKLQFSLERFLGKGATRSLRAKLLEEHALWSEGKCPFCRNPLPENSLELCPDCRLGYEEMLLKNERSQPLDLEQCSSATELLQ